MTPETMESLRGRIAELEEQLSLSDAGVSKLAERCLALEKELQTYTAAQGAEDDEQFNVQLTRAKLLYDLGFGYSEQNMLEAPQTAYQEDTHTVSAAFTLKSDARALRFDPGELPCYVTKLAVSDDRLTFRAQNGIRIDDDSFLFLHVDPIFQLEGRRRFSAGTKLNITYQYYPLQADGSDPLLPVVLQAYESTLQSGELAAAQLRDASEALEELKGRVGPLEQQLLQMTAERDYYKNAVEAMRASFCWKLTAPLRRILSIFHKG